MVQVPVFGPAEGISFPRFDRVLPAEQDCDAYVAEVEEATRGIAGAMSEKEYLARKSNAGTMPRLNRVFEELGVHHEEYVIPLEVLASIEKKKKKAAAKNVTAVAESKKRKGQVGPKVVPKK
jgi:tRNA C32,U32 (ribose-2'-O)-methylase TrmJ